MEDNGKNPFQLDSRAPKIPLQDYVYNENRYRMLTQTNPDAARALLAEAQQAVNERWRSYEERAKAVTARREAPECFEAPVADRRDSSLEHYLTYDFQMTMENDGMDLSTTYMGLTLKHPIVPSASPMSQGLDRMRRLEDSGASAIVMYSLFEEQIATESHMLDHYLTYGTDSYSEALSYFPHMESYNVGPHEYLDLIQSAKAALDVPIIGSLNGVSTGGWIEYAKYIEEAGADGIELNIYYIPTDPMMDSRKLSRCIWMCYTM